VTSPQNLTLGRSVLLRGYMCRTGTCVELEIILLPVSITATRTLYDIVKVAETVNRKKHPTVDEEKLVLVRLLIGLIREQDISHVVALSLD
jgi:hypothetical protein